ncbi:MAG: metallophosphoesterase [Alphaproteobacteria bacterium]|nr:metallophosphoesterase [Alphaproteobacteria bacterium]
MIGDVHGHADELQTLLEQMGYRESSGAYLNETRIALFVGDLIDRGPKQVDVYRLVRNMCEAGTAQCVLGNHELNAIGFATFDPETGPLRAHSERNREQHQAFLDQAGEGSSLRFLQIMMNTVGGRVEMAARYRSGACPGRASGDRRRWSDDVLLIGPPNIAFFNSLNERLRGSGC